jgi:hypothetical protein
VPKTVELRCWRDGAVRAVCGECVVEPLSEVDRELLKDDSEVWRSSWGVR